MKTALLTIAVFLMARPLPADDAPTESDKGSGRVGVQSLAKPVAEGGESMTEEEQATAEAWKVKVINEVKQRIDAAEDQRREFQRTRNLEGVRSANIKITELRKELALVRRRSLLRHLEDAQAAEAAAERDEIRRLAKEEDAKEIEALIKQAGPVAIVRFGIVMNVINFPELALVVRNTTGQTVEAFEVEAECFDKFGDKVGFVTTGNLFRGISQADLPAGAERRCQWQLSLHANTAVAHAWISRVKLADGSELRQTKEEAESRGPAAFVKATRRE